VGFKVIQFSARDAEQLRIAKTPRIEHGPVGLAWRLTLRIILSKALMNKSSIIDKVSGNPTSC